MSNSSSEECLGHASKLQLGLGLRLELRVGVELGTKQPNAAAVSLSRLPFSGRTSPALTFSRMAMSRPAAWAAAVDHDRPEAMVKGDVLFRRGAEGCQECASR